MNFILTLKQRNKMKIFEVKVRYTRNCGDNAKHVKETYIVKDETCAGVEKLIAEELKPLADGSIEVYGIKEINVYDFVNTTSAEKIFLCKVDLITIQDNGNEVRRPVKIYVGAETLEGARKEISAYLSNLDCQLMAVSETKICEIYLQ